LSPRALDNGRARLKFEDLPNSVRVAVAAEDPLVRSGLVSLLLPEPGLSPVVEVGNPVDARVTEARAELILWDTGVRVAAERRLLPDAIPTLALVADEEAALDFLRAGALGVLRRDTDGERVLSALRALSVGLVVFEPMTLRVLVSTRARPSDALFLTPRETEVLNLVAEGLSNKLIAERLKISEHTAKFHVNAILNKFDAETRTEAVVLAARRGLLML
jgi:two-component system nitrate/nitrite response regulator NarL